MENEQYSRAFRGIWISAPIWLSREITPHEKFLCAEIDSLSNPDCTASNPYLAEMIGSTAGSVAVLLSRLREKGLLLENENAGKKRVLRLAPGFLTRLRQGLTVVNEPLTGVKPPIYRENSIENGGHSAPRANEEKEAGKGKPKRVSQTVSAQDLANYVFPPSLDQAGFNAIYEEWRVHLVGKKRSLTRQTLKSLMEDCLEWGPERAAAYIRYAIRKGWSSVHENKAAFNTAGGSGFIKTAAEKVEADRKKTYTIDRDKFATLNQQGLAKEMEEIRREEENGEDNEYTTN